MDTDAFFDALAAIPNFRTAALTDMEMKPQKTGFRFRGHAAVFDEEAGPINVPGIGPVTESIQRGAFRKVLQQPANIPFTLEHDPKMVYATTRSKRLKLAEDTKGLAVDADLPDTTLARDLFALVEADVVTGMSFGFVAGKPNYRLERRSGAVHRTLFGFNKLLDVCATWDPTYPSAEAQFRSMTMQFADSAESLQQLLTGAYPQLQEQGGDPDDTPEEEAPAEPDPAPDGEPEGGGESDESGVVEQRSVAARKRALQFMVLTTGEIE